MDKIHLGYACINLSLQDKNPNLKFRAPKLNTIKKHSDSYISKVISHNLKLTYEILKFNHENSIPIYRMSSGIIPFLDYLEKGEPVYVLEELPNFDYISKQLLAIGFFAKKTNIRLTFHPHASHCIGSPTKSIVDNSLRSLEAHGKIMDLMGLEQSHWNIINIHVGGSYGNKKETLDRFCENFEKLSDSVKKRLTLENDDRKSLFTIKDLKPISEKLKIPLVFDSFHWKLHPGGQTYEEAFSMAYDTWKIKGEPYYLPVFHHSSSKKIHERSLSSNVTHADFIYEKFDNLGKEVYVELEAKKKDLALFEYLNKF